jgi:16S rRNA (guanine1516-N2)-methyltransferase
LSLKLQDTGKQEHLGLLAATEADADRAAGLAQQLGLPLIGLGADPASCKQVHVLLIVRGSTLYLQQTGKGVAGPVSVSFGSAGMRHRRRSGSGELLGRAVGVGKKTPLQILDATAGLGRDAFVLADLGCQVLLCERDPVFVELLRAGLDAASGEEDNWLTEVVSRMTLYAGDARGVPADRIPAVDVIYLDPMFPQRSKSAAVKKEMALFQRLLENTADSQDADTLLRWALQQDSARVVVKRPLRAPVLAALEPSHCVRGKSVRYDVYVHRKLS